MNYLMFLCHIYNIDENKRKGRDSSLGIATGYELDDGGVGVLVPVGSRMFSTLSSPALWPTRPPTKWAPVGSIARGKMAEA
jgi:hypothetical protein